jgi:hypothetical protein
MTWFGYIALLALALTGCDQGRQTPPNVDVTVINAAPSYTSLTFVRARDLLNAITLQYRESTLQSYNVDQYDFYVEHTATGSNTTNQLATFSSTLTAERAYQVVIAESGGTIQPIAIERPPFDPASSSTEVSLVHAASTLANIDVYLEAPGTDLSAATALGAVDFLGDLPAATHAPGDFRLFLTAAGDPSTVIFESLTFTLAAGQSNSFVLTDGAGEGVADLVVLRVGAGAALLFDADEVAGVRVVNAVSDRADKDVYLDSDVTTPLFAALPFGGVSDVQELPYGSHVLNVTPTGNPGTVELAQTAGLGAGGIYTVIATGATGSVTGAVVLENRRPLADLARLQIINAAPTPGDLAFYIRVPDTDTAGLAPDAYTVAPTVTPLVDLPPGTYEFSVRNSDGTTLLAGPTPFTVAAGGNYGFLVLDAVGGSTVDVVLIDDFN